MIIVLGSVESTPERFTTLLEICQKHALKSRTEPGNISYDLQVHTEDSNKIVFTEEWEDMDSLQTHVVVSEAFIKRLSGVASQAPSIKVYEGNLVDFGNASNSVSTL